MDDDTKSFDGDVKKKTQDMRTLVKQVRSRLINSNKQVKPRLGQKKATSLLIDEIENEPAIAAPIAKKGYFENKVIDMKKLIDADKSNTKLREAQHIVKSSIAKLEKSNKAHKVVTAVNTELSGFVQKSIEVITDLADTVKVYAAAFEELSTEIRKLSDIVEGEVSMDAIKSLANKTMKESVDKFEESLNSVGKYFDEKQRSKFDTSIKSLRSIYSNTLKSIDDDVK